MYVNIGMVTKQSLSANKSVIHMQTKIILTGCYTGQIQTPDDCDELAGWPGEQQQENCPEISDEEGYPALEVVVNSFCKKKCIILYQNDRIILCTPLRKLVPIQIHLDWTPAKRPTGYNQDFEL